MTARLLLRLLALLPACLALDAPAEITRQRIDHNFVTGLAKDLAAKPYQAPPAAPQFFRDLNYDAYRGITFRPERALWRDGGLAFQVQPAHPGYLFKDQVQLNEFTADYAQSVPFAQSLFDYHDLKVPLLSHWNLNFAGFRVFHPLNGAGQWNEVIAFLSGTYYRALGRDQAYGASARGLALNAGGPAPEEFPVFREFWLGKPAAGEKTLTVHALLDGPSVTGAYTFVITPGPETIVETQATLFFRRAAPLAGFAPLSSMFWYGEASDSRFGDFRPEVHDSDGLLVAPDAQTRLWRPLVNPTEVRRTDIEAPAFAGFGLLQRDRAGANYADLEGHYERRPGIWTEPVGTWPPGQIRLVEMPTKDEYQDNVTAYWTPRDPIKAGQRVDLAWKQHWSGAATFGGPPGWVAATRQTLHAGTSSTTRCCATRRTARGG
jgi:glucans biosynthesis protein